MSGRDTKAQADAIVRSSYEQPSIAERLERIENLLYQLVDALRHGRPIGGPS